MNEYLNVKDKIIKTTIDLIKDSNGFVENITIRKIAESANVAVGLINYHFSSKENLIEICVQKIISNVMRIFPNLENSNEYFDNNQDITSFSSNVFKFLLNNSEISKISMLSDLTNPSPTSNSSISFKAICKTLTDEKLEQSKKIKAFIFLATLQAAFLNKDISQELLSINLNYKNDYQNFFKEVVKILNI